MAMSWSRMSCEMLASTYVQPQVQSVKFSKKPGWISSGWRPECKPSRWVCKGLQLRQETSKPHPGLAPENRPGMLPDILRGPHTCYTHWTNLQVNTVKEEGYPYILEEPKPQHHQPDQSHGQMSLKTGTELKVRIGINQGLVGAQRPQQEAGMNHLYSLTSHDRNCYKGYDLGAA